MYPAHQRAMKATERFPERADKHWAWLITVLDGGRAIVYRTLRLTDLRRDEVDTPVACFRSTADWPTYRKFNREHLNYSQIC
jgi:hypothetical protein